MHCQITGNEYISLPTIRESDGAAEGVTFLYMQVKGLLELRGKAGLIRPYMEAEGQRLLLHPGWTREHCWIPGFVSEEQGLRLSCVYLTPVGERGFVVRLVLQNLGDQARQVRFGVAGEWERTLHEINETTELNAGREAYESGWNHMFIFSQKPGLPLFAFAPCVADPQQFAQIDQHAEWTRDGFAYDIYRTLILQPGEKAVLDIPWGVGYDGVAAATSAKELLRQGFDAVCERTVRWLAAREKRLADSRLSEILNSNLFFAFFYIPTKELKNQLLYSLEQEFSTQTFRTRIIGKMRDEGVIIASSSPKKGYKIPATKAELYDFINHGTTIILPMLERLKKCRDTIKLGTANQLDLFEKTEYSNLKKYFDDINLVE